MTRTTTRAAAAALALTAAAGPRAPADPPAAVPVSVARPADAPAELALEDQFGRPAELAALRGQVAVLVFGDRGGTDVCRAYGEHLHTLFHPAAKGQPADKARTAPVAPLAGVPAGKPSPDVLVVPVACAGKVPAVVKEFIQGQVRKSSPNATVWMDFQGLMADRFGLRPGDVNLAVFDAVGRLRMTVNGTPDRATAAKLAQTIQDLRAEAVGLSR